MKSYHQFIISCTADADLLARLDADARAEDRSRSKTIKRALEYYLASKNARQPQGEAA